MAFEKELDVAREAAKEAGQVMARYQRDGFDVERKSSYADLVTEADEEAQEAVVSTIQEEFPEDGFLGEENDLRPDGEDRVWVIDPIDGTTNFVHGLPNYCVSIGLEENGEAVAGVVYWPVHDWMFTATAGGGAYRNGESITVSDTTDVRDAIVIPSLFSSRNSHLLGEIGEVRQELAEEGASLRRPGAAAPSLSYLAAGNVDGVVIIATSRWDISASKLLVREAGGTVRIRDSVLDGYLEVVASNGHIQQELEEVFDRHVSG